MDHLSKHDVGGFRVACISSEKEEALLAGLAADGFACYLLNAKVITDKESFLGELVRSGIVCLDSDDRLTNWDVASDLLWQRLMEQPESSAAVIWQNAHFMLDGRLQLLIDGLEILFDVAEISERQEVRPDCHPVLMRVILIGEGANFRAWS